MLILLPLFTGYLLWICFVSTLPPSPKRFSIAMLEAAIGLGVLVVAITEGLSFIHCLQKSVIALSWSLIILVLILILNIQNYSIKPPSFFPLKGSKMMKLIRLWGIILLVLLAGLGLIVPPNNWDSMTYHLPRAMHWLQNQTVAHYPTSNLRQLCQGPWSSFALLQIYVLWGSDRLLPLLQWLSVVGCCVGVSLIAEQLGTNTKGKMLSIIFTITLPMGILQATTTQNDLICSFWLICLLYYTIDSWQAKFLRPRNGCFLALSLGLLFLTKGTGYIFALPIIFSLAIVHRRQLLTPIVCYAFIPLLLNSGHYYRNSTLFQNLLYTELDYKNRLYSVQALISNVARNISFHIPISESTVPVSTYFIRWIHDVIGLSPNHSLTTWQNSKFMVIFSPMEDIAGNPFHFYLIILCLGLMGFNAIVRRQCHALHGLYWGLLLSSFILFCFLLRWQLWQSRLQLPLFIMAAPMVGYCLQSYLPSRYGTVGALFLLLIANYWLLFNFKKPVFASENIFNTPRIEQYFQGLDTVEAYQETAQYLAQTECRNIGLMLGSNDGEYLLWRVLEDVGVTQSHLEHVGVDNASAITTRPFQPCAITHLGNPLPLPFTLNGQIFTQRWQPEWERHASPAILDPSLQVYLP